MRWTTLIEPIIARRFKRPIAPPKPRHPFRRYLPRADVRDWLKGGVRLG